MKQRLVFLFTFIILMFALVGFGDKGYDNTNPDEVALMKVDRIKQAVKKEGYSIKAEQDYYSFGNSDLSFYALGKYDGSDFIKEEHYAVSHLDGGIYIIEEGKLNAVSGPQYELEQAAIKEISKIPLVAASLKNSTSVIKFDKHALFTRFRSNGRDYNVEGDRFVLETEETPSRRYFWYLKTKVADKNFYGVWEEYLLSEYGADTYYYDSFANNMPDFKQALSQGGKATDIDDYVEQRTEVEKGLLATILGFGSTDNIVHQKKTVKIDKYQFNVFTVENDSPDSVGLEGTFAVNIVLGKIYLLDDNNPKKNLGLIYERGN